MSTLILELIVALYVQNNNNNNNDNNNKNNNNNSVIYFDSFGVERIPKEIKAFINIKNITTNIFSVKAHDLIMCGYFCIGFIDFILAGKTLIEYTNLFSPNNFNKNEDMILNYFMRNI